MIWYDVYIRCNIKNTNRISQDTFAKKAQNVVEKRKIVSSNMKLTHTYFLIKNCSSLFLSPI